MDIWSILMVAVIWPLGVILSFLILIFVIAQFSLTNKWLRDKKIKKKFAWIPVSVEGKDLWLKTYYELKEVGAFSFGGSSQVDVSHKGRFICFSSRGQGKTSVYYESRGSFLTISGLKKLLREQELFENRYQKAVEDRKRIEKNKEIFKKLGWDKYFN